MEPIMRAYIAIVALAVIIAMCVIAFEASTQDETYADLDCTGNCSEHEAGYKWAEQHSIDDEDYCPVGPSQSFQEGCIAYVQRELTQTAVGEDK
jgi:hypothetical protein